MYDHELNDFQEIHLEVLKWRVRQNWSFYSMVTQVFLLLCEFKSLVLLKTNLSKFLPMGKRGKSEEVLILLIASNYADNLSGMKRKG